jgi:WD40 repeat protein/serine/threonine protein kinase
MCLAAVRRTARVSDLPLNEGVRAMNEQAIFIAALQEDPDKRAAYLDRACGADPALRQRVENLLDAHERAGSFLKQPAAAVTDAYRPISEGPGTVIGPYKLLQQIGEGGFGVVYMAEQQEPVRRKVALKIIRPGMDSREVIARFESERKALALMDHPNVARVLDAGATDSGRPYFVMELVRGVPVTDFCDKNHLPAAGRLELFTDVCRAVQHAHQKGIIHRDLKPSNILVTLHDGRPVPKVIDFGVAKATSQQLTQKTLFTAYGQMVGTPAYMSPEQAEMSGLDIDTRSDIYSLGVLLYELLTGTTPLEGKRLREAGYAEMQRMIREEEPPRPSTRLTSLGGEATVLAGNRGTDVKHLAQLLRGDLDWLVMKALEKDRNRRYETPGAFAADVERFLHNEAILARPPSALYRLRKFAHRNRAAVLTAALVALLLVLGIAGTTVGLVWAVNAETVARRARDDAEIDATQARDARQLAEDRLTEVGRERDGANKLRAEAVTNAQLLKDALALSDSRLLAAQSLVQPTNPGLALLLALAATDRAPARSALHNNALVNALRDCREERTLFAPPFATPEGRTGRTEFLTLQVTPDGTRAVTFGQRLNDPGADYHFAEDKTDSAYVYDLTTGQVATTLRMPGVSFPLMAISPDSRLLAAVPNTTVVVRYKDGQLAAYTQRAVRLWDLHTGQEVRVLTGHTDNVASLCFDTKGERLLTASWDGTARVWDLATGKALHVLADSKMALEQAEFSPDGRRVLTVRTNEHRWGPDVAKSEGRTSGLGRRFPLEKTTIDPPLRTSAAVDWVDTILGLSMQGSGGIAAPQLWDAATGKCLAVLTTKPADESYQHQAAGFSPDSARVVTMDSSKMSLWNAEDGKIVIDNPPGRVKSEQFVIDGVRRLHVLRPDEGAPDLLIWQSDAKQQEWRRPRIAARREWGRPSTAEAQDRFLDGTVDGPPLTAQSAGDAVLISSSEDGGGVAVLRGHDDMVSAAAFLPGGRRILTASLDGTLRLWNLDPTRQPVVELRMPQGSEPVGYAMFLPGGRQILTAPAPDRFSRFAGKTVSLWDAGTGALVSEPVTEASLATSELHEELLGELRDLDVSRDGERLVTVHMDLNPRDNFPRDDPKDEPKPHPLYTPVRVWDLRTGKQLCALPGLRLSVATARFSPDGRRILTFSDGSHQYAILRDGKRYGAGGGGPLRARVDLWDALTGKHLRNLVPETFGGGSFAQWSPDGKLVLTNALYHIDSVAADLFDADTGARVRRLKADGAGIDRAEFSPDGKLVLGTRINIMQGQHRVDVWDVATGERRLSLGGHTGDVTSAVFSPDSRSILTTSTDRTARLWDVATGESRRAFVGHRQVIQTGRFSPDGKWVVTASNDGTARVWSVETGQEWMTLPAPQGRMINADFDPDSRRLLTASTDGAARVWPVDPLPPARDRKPRELTDDERARFHVEAAK